MAEYKERDVRQVVLGKEDDDIKEFLEENPARFSTYVKGLIRRDMNGQDNADIIEARLNEIITMLKRGSVAQQSSTAGSHEKGSISEKQKNTIKNVMGVFK